MKRTRPRSDLVHWLYLRGSLLGRDRRGRAFRSAPFYSAVIAGDDVGYVHMMPVQNVDYLRYDLQIVDEAELPLNMALASIRAARTLYADRLIKNVIRAPFGCYDFDLMRLDDWSRPRSAARAVLQLVTAATLEVARLESRIGAWRIPTSSQSRNPGATLEWLVC